MENQFDFTQAEEILASYGRDKKFLISLMQELQNVYHYLPKEVLQYVADQLKITVAKVYSVATFYENFSLEPKGKYVIRICDGTACHVRKSIPILQRLREELQLSDKKHTTDDMLFTLETVSCLGACGLAPVITINDVVHASMTPDKAVELLTKMKQEESVK